MNAHWQLALSALLHELKSIDFGYPIGENEIVRSPSRDAGKVLRSAGILSPDLERFYGCCDGIRLPDVHNGYFIKSLEEFKMGLESREPTSLDGCQMGAIAVVGSTGGGKRFAINLQSSAIWVLGNGLVQNRVFMAEKDNAKEIAPNWDHFLSRLVADVRAFVKEVSGHQYLV